jgi:hypothetical protein
MKIPILTLLLSSAILYLNAQQASFDWALQCNNPPNTTDTKTVLATGEDNSFYIAGEFVDTAIFDKDSLISAGGTDVFLVKNDNEGSPEWAVLIGAADYDYVQAIRSIPGGGICMAGYFYGATRIGTDTYSSFGSQDIFIACFDEQGNFNWSRRAGGLSADYVSSMDVDQDNNIVIAGYFYGDLEFGDTILHASAGLDTYIAKFSSGGELLWALAAGGSSSDQLRSVSIDPQGNIYFTGSFYYDFTISDTTIATANPVGGFLAELDPDGNLLRIMQIEGTYLTPDIFVEADNEGNYYLAGNFSEDIWLGDSNFVAGPFNQDIFAAKYSANGQFVWASHATGYSSDQLMGIGTDIYNNLYLTGHFLDTIRFGQLMMPYKLCCGSKEIFLVNYDFNGKVLWGKQITGPRANVQSMCIDEAGDIRLSGLFTDTLAFDALDLSSISAYRTYITNVTTEMYTGVPKHNVNERYLLVSPNPATDLISVDLSSPEALVYRIYNSSGNLVRSAIWNDNQWIDVRDLPPGLYIIQLITVSGEIKGTGKFICH